MHARSIQVTGGGSAECWSLVDPDSGRGRQYNLVVIDEAAQIADLEHAWERTIRSMLLARIGTAWFLSTPTGIAHYFHTVFQKGREPSRNQEWRSWQMPTSANPHIRPEEIEAMRRDMTELAYRQEIEAEFVSWQGAVFSHLREAITTAPQGKAAVIGVDWAGSSGGGDYTAIVMLSQQGHVLEIVRLRGQEFTPQRARLKGLWERHGKPPILSEANNMGEGQNQQLRLEGMFVEDWVTTHASKTRLVSQLVQAFEQGSIRIPDDPVLLCELQAFQCTPLPGGQFRYGAPPGAHDDTVLALGIAYQGLGTARKRDLAYQVFQNLGEINMELATGSAYHQDDGGQHQHWGSAERARVLTMRWPS